MADVCTSLMAEWKSLTQHEMGWYVPARGLRAGLSQQLFLRERWSECLPALHQLSLGAVTVGFPLSQLC